jgi:hypothetical protein
MAMDGTVLHRWRQPFERAFPDRRPTNDCAFFRRAHLLADGGLVVLYQGGGLARLDRASRLLWRAGAVPYNDLWVASDGERILTLHKQAVARPELGRPGAVLEDFVLALDGGGRELWRASLLEAFARSPYRDLVSPLGSTPDLFHSNTIEVLAGAGTAAGGAFAAGNLLVSLREIDTLAILDPQARTVLWARRGPPWAKQHEPSLLPTGRLLLFDNQGGEGGGSRALELDPGSGAVAVRWPPAGVRFRSRQAGAAAQLPNGDLLVVESERGAAFEVDAAGRIVWEFRSPHRAGARGELVATLFDLVRLPAATPFLARFAPAQAP